ncbi:MAG: flagellar hook-length control protein FliK [Myxococcus sp.]|nr:flagellar hook-length control protein FliK [Myxococcus sp.]
MSRVDDDRQAARAAERQMEARRNEELQKGKKASEATTFKKLVGQQQAQGQAQQKHATQKQADLGKSAIASLLEGSEAHAKEETRGAREGQQTFTSRLKGSHATETQHKATRNEGEHQQAVGEGGRQVDQQGARAAQTDKGNTARALEGRKADAAQGRAALEEAHESSELSSTGAAAGAGGARGEKGDLKADADKGGGGQGGSGQKDGKDSPAMQPGFRFNPALMAPVPVAKQKDVSGSERLRQVANELAQKIVERVRIGTNAAGKVEFQIDLRSDVLKGLSVKVSSHNGKIKAVFQGSDRDVLKLIEEQKEALTKALSARGLSLEDFKIEGRP